MEMLIGRPFIMSMMYAFQDEKFLYMVLELARGGDLFMLLYKTPESIKKREAMARFVMVELILALEQLHEVS